MECPHLVLAVTMAGVRKRVKKGTQIICHPCTFKPFRDSQEYWFCLQCGNIGCGDSDAQQGDAKKHFDTPRSDDHSLVLHLGNDSRCWCFKCNKEISGTNGHLRDAVTFIKRHFKYNNVNFRKGPENQAIKMQESGEETPTPPAITTSIAIPLPPPSPPPSTFDCPKKKKKSISDRRNQQLVLVKNKPRGLVNIGNTCFMNSALQCLASTRLLVPRLHVFGSGNSIRVVVTQSQDEAIVTVLELDNGSMITDDNLSSSSSGVDSIVAEDEIAKPLLLKLDISPSSMTGRMRNTINAIRRINSQDIESGVNEPNTYASSYEYSSNSHNPCEVQNLVAKQFRRGQQHDSHELLRTILDMMKKDQTKAFRVAIMEHYGIVNKGEGSDPNLLELVKALDQKVKNKTFVDEIFGGELVTTQTCLTCKHVKRSHEQFLDLSLPIRVVKPSENEDEKKPFKRFSLFDQHCNNVINNTLNDCLRSFTEPELMTGSNEVECENCHKMKLAQMEIDDENEFVVISADDEHIQENGPEPEPIQIEDLEKIDSPQAVNSTNIMSELSVLKLETPEEGGGSDTDLDLPPAVDGVCRSASSSVSGASSGNPGISLGLPDYDKFENYRLQAVSDAHYDNEEDMETKLEKPSTADDEGFSEGENSTAVENEAQQGPSNGPSESSSRNSISDPEENKSSEERDNKSDPDLPSTNINKKPKVTVTKRPCSRQQNISRPPECLTIHLKRFQIGMGGLPQKLNDSVKFPSLLDLTPYCTQDDEDKNKNSIFDENEEVIYSLYGIVEHSGSINWGHYVAYVKYPSEEVGGSDQWYYISDSIVTPTTERSALNQEAYILFYERIRGDEKNKKKIVTVEEACKEVSEDCWQNWDTNTTIVNNGNGETVDGDQDDQPQSHMQWDYPTVHIPETGVNTNEEDWDKDADSGDIDMPALESILDNSETETILDLKETTTADLLQLL